MSLGFADVVSLLEIMQARHGLQWINARNARALGVEGIAELDHFHHKHLTTMKKKTINQKQTNAPYKIIATDATLKQWQ